MMNEQKIAIQNFQTNLHPGGGAWVPIHSQQTIQVKLSEWPGCNDMVADLHFPQFYGTAIQCEIARRFQRSVVKVGLNFKAKISVF